MGFVIFMLWALAALYVLNAVLMPLMIGKERKPYTAGAAVGTIIFQLFLAVVVAWAAVLLSA